MITCSICPRRCEIDEGERGFCRARENVEGHLFPVSYGRLTDLSICPVSTLPFERYFKESTVLAVGSFGSHEEFPEEEKTSLHLMPDELARLACIQKGNGVSGIAYAFSEPLLNWEYVRDCSRAARRSGLKMLVVTDAMTDANFLYRMLYAVDAVCVRLASGSFLSLDSKMKNAFRENLETIQKLSLMETVYESSGLLVRREEECEEIAKLAEMLSWINVNAALSIRQREKLPSDTYFEQAERLAQKAREYLSDVLIVPF